MNWAKFIRAESHTLPPYVWCGTVFGRRDWREDFEVFRPFFSAHKKAHKTLDLECLSITYGVVRAFQVIVNTLLCS
jgi:hypothetical protein